jgi:hypothetical protein
MHVRYHTGTLARHGARALVEGALIVGIIASLVFAISLVAGRDPAGATGVFARGTSTSWIELDSVNARSASIQPTLGSEVTFATSYPKTIKNPRIEVLCYQDGSLVYGEAGGAHDTFLLGGGGSAWKDGGGAADCRANLYYFGYKAGKQTYNRLATTTFSAGG